MAAQPDPVRVFAQAVFRRERGYLLDAGPGRPIMRTIHAYDARRDVMVVRSDMLVTQVARAKDAE